MLIGFLSHGGQPVETNKEGRFVSRGFDQRLVGFIVWARDETEYHGWGGMCGRGCLPQGS